MNILIVEDDLFLSEKIKNVFHKRIITNKITLLQSFSDFLLELPIINAYDIVLLDIKLGETELKNGFDIIQIIRKKNINIPIIMMSGFDDIPSIERAFNFGANDYIIKPFRLKEFEIRVMKWFQNYCMSIIFSHSKVLSYKNLCYNFDENDFYFKDKKINLTKNSKFLLFQLLIQPEKLINENELSSKIWCDRDTFKKRNLRINILRLKKSLKEFHMDNRIKNQRGEGYILKKNKK